MHNPAHSHLTLTIRRTYCGSETYTSPEVLAGKRFSRIPQEVAPILQSPFAQIWSLGVLLWVMVYGQNPFENVVEAEQCHLNFPTHVAVSQVASWTTLCHLNAVGIIILLG
jgi:serine/threonine protein kinase